MASLVHAVVVAAGKGTRLGDSTAGGSGPKALRCVGGRPLVELAVSALFAAGVETAFIVISPEYSDLFEQALTPHQGKYELIAGGDRRQDSVAAGVARVDVDAAVLVHDAARPLVPMSIIRRVIDAVHAGADVVVPAIAVADSLRRVVGDGSEVVDRSRLRAVQTPQGFAPGVLQKAHARQLVQEFTDDASLCEAGGATVTLVEGSVRAMKVTTPGDFAMAEALLQQGE